MTPVCARSMLSYEKSRTSPRPRQNAAKVLHNNRIKFLIDFSRCCSVRQHGGRDVTWKLRIGLSSGSSAIQKSKNWSPVLAIRQVTETATF